MYVYDRNSLQPRDSRAKKQRKSSVCSLTEATRRWVLSWR